METEKTFKNDLPDNPEKHTPARPDKDPDPTKKTPHQPKEIDPTRIDEPQKTSFELSEPLPSSPKE